MVNGLSHDLPNAVLHHMVHRETFDVMFAKVDPLIGINVSDSDEDQVLEGEGVGEPVETWDERFA